ncbi:DoxX family membrane protein [Lentzea guizhouensis]|nr:DoxX family membrane protein [Lentzea guizhouensis]
MIWFATGPKLVLVLRLLLAAVFIMYGTIKLLGGQYYYGDWTIDKATTDGTSLVWAFYGYSPFYGRATGLFELIPAVMLLFRRTTTLGALGLFAVALNITLMDFAFDYPEVKYFALAYTLIAAALVLSDRRKLTFLLADTERRRDPVSGRRASRGPGPSSGDRGR